jgi:hypothetical protein
MPLTSQSRRVRAHVCAGVAAIVATASACTGGTATNAPPPTGVFGLTGGSGTGTGGTGGNSGSSGGIDVVATYRLRTVNGSALPARLVDDSVVTTDSTHIFRAWLDSAFISLNTDTTAIVVNFLSLFETRTGAALSGLTFMGDSVAAPDTSSGTYHYDPTAATVRLSLADTVNSTPVSSTLLFGVSIDSLVANLTYTVFDLSGIPQTTTAATFVYTNSGAPAHDVVLKPWTRVTVARRGLAASRLAAVRHVATQSQVRVMQLRSASPLLQAVRH